MGYHRAGFDVVGVDIVPQPNYPFEFTRGEAISDLDRLISGGGMLTTEGGRLNRYLLSDFDAIHASPPCQRWSTKTAYRWGHPDLVSPLRPLLEGSGLPFVIENVLAAPLRRDVVLCGSSFGLGVRRHRVFESNVSLLAPPCSHWQSSRRYAIYDHGRWYESPSVHVFGEGGGKGREFWQEAMGIDWTDDTRELAEAIPPAYTELIGHQLLQSIRVAAGQGELFPCSEVGTSG